MKKTLIIIAAALTFNFGLGIFGLKPGACFAQSVGINATGAVANSSALLDISDSGIANPKGLLIPRMTTTQRNAIPSPAWSLLIFNTTTDCFEAWDQNSSSWVSFGCIGCAGPTGVSASASPNPICVGSTLTLTGTATGATAWSWTGPNGFTSSLQSPTIASITTAGAGVYTLAAGNTCAWTTGVNTASVSVSAAPTTSNAGSAINPACGVSTATLGGNTPVVGTGTWTVVSGTATITNPSSPTSGVTGLAVPGTAVLQWTISNSPCTASSSTVTITTTSCVPTCGTQVWATANLNVGSVIDIASEQIALGEEWCYNNVAANCTAYGGLYEWTSAVNISYASYISTVVPGPPAWETCNPCGAGGQQGICPANYHIPTDLEWSQWEYCIENNIAPAGTTTFVTFSTTAGWRGSTNNTAGVYQGPGAKMKETTAQGGTWADGAYSNNLSGFSALPGGYSFGGTSLDLGTSAYFWSATENGDSFAWYRFLYTGNAQAYRGNYSKLFGFSVRCLHN